MPTLGVGRDERKARRQTLWYRDCNRFFFFYNLRSLRTYALARQSLLGCKTGRRNDRPAESQPTESLLTVLTGQTRSAFGCLSRSDRNRTYWFASRLWYSRECVACRKTNTKNSNNYVKPITLTRGHSVCERYNVYIRDHLINKCAQA